MVLVPALYMVKGPAVETATRVAVDGTRLLFLLNHAPRPARLTAHAPATDLLTGERAAPGAPLVLGPLGVAVLQQIRRPRASGTPDLRRK
ncbi:Beta-galactosidase C-terminal domain [Streptomyces sp. NPDC096046]|uniref:Beta-galactosidase C-terminal domain n=1 Tax=Streptomyces sp. NPDC096046 TaxID=3155542 RepID=UPI0033333912